MVAAMTFLVVCMAAPVPFAVRNVAAVLFVAAVTVPCAAAVV